MKDDRFRDLLVRHVLGELEGHERAALDAELERRGEDGRRELARVRETLGRVALDAEPEAPPERLREKVLAAAAETPQEPAPDGASEPSPGSGDAPGSESAPAAGGSSSDGVDISGSRPPGRGPSGRGWLAAAAAVLAAAAIGLFWWSLQLQSELDRTTARLDSVAARLARAESASQRLESLRSDLATVASPEATVRTLAGTDARPGARARVFVNPASGRALLFAYDLPILPPDSVYQLWAIEGEQPRSMGTFTKGEEGPARAELDTLDPLRAADALAVTVEPAPGQPAPTGQMVLQGTL